MLYLQNYKTSNIFIYITIIFNENSLLLVGLFKYFHLFTSSAMLSIHTKLRIWPGSFSAKWSLQDFYRPEKNNDASMIDRLDQWLIDPLFWQWLPALVITSVQQQLKNWSDKKTILNVQGWYSLKFLFLEFVLHLCSLLTMILRIRTCQIFNVLKSPKFCHYKAEMVGLIFNTTH